MPVNLVEIDLELTEIFDKNRYNGHVGNCNVSVGQYNNINEFVQRIRKVSNALK